MLASAMSAATHEFDIRRLAGLARLTLTPDEHTVYAEQLGRILELASRVQRAETAGVPPMTHAGAPALAERPDEPGPSLTQTEATANAPDATDAWFRVPQVIG